MTKPLPGLVAVFFWAVAALPGMAADTSSIDCSPAGGLTLLSGSGLRIVVDGENGGCNETGDRYSFGNVLEPIRVYPGSPGVTGSQAEELLIDTPLEFVRMASPLGGLPLLVGQWTTRRGFKVFISGGALSSRPEAGLTIHEFLVYEPGNEPFESVAFFREWRTAWNTPAPTQISGVVLDGQSGAPGLGIADAEISLFRCRAQDGLVNTARSDSAGAFAFDVEEDGYYQLGVVPPAGFKTPPEERGTSFKLFPNGFTQCVDFRVTPEDRRNRRTGGLFARDPDTPIVLRLSRED